MLGLAARTALKVKPSLSIASWRMLCTKASAVGISFISAALPASVLRSSTTERLLRLKLAKMARDARRRHRGRHGAHAVALRRLDLDDLGAQVAQDLRGVGAEDDGGEVENAQAFEQGDHEEPWPKERSVGQ